MNKILMGSFLVLAGLLSFSNVQAAEQTVDSLFGVEISDINKVSDQVSLFNFVTTSNSTTSDAISSWKIRVYCEEGMLVLLGGKSLEDNCGKAVELNDQEAEKFSILFLNTETILKKFSFKLKAYDNNGKWLHTETENFSWK